MDCPACSAEVEDGADLCLGCGEPLSAAMRRAASAPPPPPSAQLAKPQSASVPATAMADVDLPPVFARASGAKARRRGDDEDPRCPGCGIRNAREASRCRSCGARFPQHD